MHPHMMNSKVRSCRWIPAAAIAFCAAAALAFPSMATALVNGGFELGTLDGWYASPGSVAYVASASGALGRGISDPSSGNWHPTEGGYFGVLHTAPVSPASGAFELISSSFGAGPGDLLAFDVFFDAGEEAWSGRRGMVRLVNDGDLSGALLYACSVADVGDYGADGWSRVAHEVGAAGTYHLELSLIFEGGPPAFYDAKLGSALGIDQFEMRPPGVPEPGTLLLLGPALAGFGLCRRRR